MGKCACGEKQPIHRILRQPSGHVLPPLQVNQIQPQDAYDYASLACHVRSEIEYNLLKCFMCFTERLWSPVHSANSTATARARLSRFRCLLNERGVGAGPVRNYYAREGPYEPGSCYDQ